MEYIMKLPKFDMPKFEVVLPSTDKKVKYRPFTVKEEKILLIAKESGDYEQILLATEQIIENCVEGVDVKKLTTFDIEYLFISIRAKSVNNVIEFSIKDNETDEKINLVFDINDIKVFIPEGHTKVVEIEDGYSMIMRYPSVKELLIFKDMNDDNAQEIFFKTMVSCIDKIVNGDVVYEIDNFSEEEIQEFVDSLPGDAVVKIRHFFETMPSMKYVTTYKRSDGTEKQFVVQGLDSFFI